MRNINVKIEDKNATLILLVSLPLSNKNFVQSLLGGKDTVTLEEIRLALLGRGLGHKADGSVRDNETAGWLPAGGRENW